MPHLEHWVQTCRCLLEGLLPLAPLPLRWLLNIRRGRSPVGRDDPGPPNVKFSANFLAYKNLRRGGYQPPGSRKHPRLGRILSAPTTSLHHISHGIHSEAECTGGLLRPLRRPPANPHPMSPIAANARADVGIGPYGRGIPRRPRQCRITAPVASAGPGAEALPTTTPNSAPNVSNCGLNAPPVTGL